MNTAAKPRLLAFTDQSTIDRIYNDYTPVFVLTTGRSGSKYLAWLLNHSSNIKAFHEPNPSLQYFSNFAFHNQDKAEVLAKMIDAARMELVLRAYIENRIFVESNQCMTFFAPAIRDTFKGSRFVHIVRHPGDFARSAYRKGFHRSDSIWESGRVRMRDKKRWDQLGHIEKLGWLWQATHNFVEDFKRDIEADRVATFKAEDLFKDKNSVRSLLDFVGAAPIPDGKIEKIQKTKVNELSVRTDEPSNMIKNVHFPTYRIWNGRMKDQLRRYTSELSDLYGYDLDKDDRVEIETVRDRLPLLSVIVPNFNNGPFLRECLDSVLAQTYESIEIVVCDDCSTDNSRAIVRDYEKKYPEKVKGLFLKENRGVAFVRNYAASCAKGEYMTELDSDDYYYNNRKLENEMKLVLYHKRTKKKDVVAFSDIVRNTGDNAFAFVSLAKPVKEGMIFDEILTRSCMVPRDYVVLKKAFDECGGYDTGLTTHEDWDLKARLAARHEFHYTGSAGTMYRRHPDGLSSLPFKERKENMRTVFEKNLHAVTEKKQKLKLAKGFTVFMDLQNTAEERLALIRRQNAELKKRQKVIETLHHAAQERLDLIHRLDAELKLRQVVIETLQSKLETERQERQ